MDLFGVSENFQSLLSLVGISSQRHLSQGRLKTAEAAKMKHWKDSQEYIQFPTLLLRWVEMSSWEWRSHIIIVVVDGGCHIFSPSERDIECTENFPFFLLLELQVWVDIFYGKGRLKSFKNSSSSTAAIVEFILLLNKRVVQPSHHLWCVPSIFPALCWCCYSSLTYIEACQSKKGQIMWNMISFLRLLSSKLECIFFVEKLSSFSILFTFQQRLPALFRCRLTSSLHSATCP